MKCLGTGAKGPIISFESEMPKGEVGQVFGQRWLLLGKVQASMAVHQGTSPDSELQPVVKPFR